MRPHRASGTSVSMLLCWLAEMACEKKRIMNAQSTTPPHHHTTTTTQPLPLPLPLPLPPPLLRPSAGEQGASAGAEAVPARRQEQQRRRRRRRRRQQENGRGGHQVLPEPIPSYLCVCFVGVYGLFVCSFVRDFVHVFVFRVFFRLFICLFDSFFRWSFF